MGGCRLRAFELTDDGVRARCSCGWVSEPSATAEEAGAQSDAHRLEGHP